MRLLTTTRHTLRSLLRPHAFITNPLDQLPSSFRAMSSSAASKRLAGKTIVVTGASSGIGRSTALEFARTAPQDLRLVLTARRLETLKEVAAQIKEEVGEGVKVLPVKLDVSNPAEIKAFVGDLPEEWRDIDVLVNNAYDSHTIAQLSLSFRRSLMTDDIKQWPRQGRCPST